MAYIVFETRDTALAAALKVSGMKLIKLRFKGPVAFFIFDQRERCEQLADDYWTDKLQVPAKPLIISLRELKQMIYCQGFVK